MKNMDVAPGGGNNLKQEDSGNFEEENVWLQEWIREELAHGEVWQRQYEELLGHQAQLFFLLQTKSLAALEKKTETLQEELEEAQEILQKYKNQSCQRQLQIQKQEKENQRMAATIKELEKKVFKQHLEEKSKDETLKELKMQSHELKRHLSEWQAKWQTKNDQNKQRHQQVEKLNNIIQGLSLKSEVCALTCPNLLL